MKFEEFVKLSEVTEKKFPDGINISPDLYERLMESLSKFANDPTLDKLKKELIYQDHEAVPDMVYLNNIEIETIHGVLGMVTEVQEIVQWLLKGGKDSINLMEELSDEFWYIALLVRLHNIDVEEGYERNINKLKARYGEKFSNYAALNRDLDTERQILEGN